MSGRVGDLSPKQKEALAKVSPQPGPTPVLGRGPRPLRQPAWKGLDGGLATIRGGRAAEGAASGGTWRPAPRPSSLHWPRGPRKFGHPSPSPERALGGATWEEVVAWKPSEAAEGTKATFILGTGSRARGAGAGAGPQVSSHFREVFLLRGQWQDGKGPGQRLRRLG